MLWVQLCCHCLLKTARLLCEVQQHHGRPGLVQADHAGLLAVVIMSSHIGGGPQPHLALQRRRDCSFGQRSRHLRAPGGRGGRRASGPRLPLWGPLGRGPEACCGRLHLVAMHRGLPRCSTAHVAHVRQRLGPLDEAKRASSVKAGENGENNSQGGLC